MSKYNPQGNIPQDQVPPKRRLSTAARLQIIQDLIRAPVTDVEGNVLIHVEILKVLDALKLLQETEITEESTNETKENS